MKQFIYATTISVVFLLSGCSSHAPCCCCNSPAYSDISPQSHIVILRSADKDDKKINTKESLSPTTSSSIETMLPISNEVNLSLNDTNKLSSIYFDFDKYTIRDDMRLVLKTNSVLVHNRTIKLEGDCDEFGSDEYNDALGLKRAKSVKDALIELGIRADSINIISLGKHNPVCSEAIRSCWSKNRRVDFTLQNHI